MKTHQLHRRIWLPTKLSSAFEFFCDPMNLQRITPPELDLVVHDPPELPLRKGSEMGYRLHLFGVPFRWRTVFLEWKDGSEFVDASLRSPFKRWEHRHVLYAEGDGTAMLDLVDYALPLWPLGEVAHFLVRRQLERIFDYRESPIREIFAAPAKAQPA